MDSSPGPGARCSVIKKKKPMSITRDYRHSKFPFMGKPSRGYSIRIKVPVHISLLVLNCLSKHRIPVLPQPAYPFDFARLGFFLGLEFA
ncbi:hypothetical protein AVEN_1663-1 [Araneus ventricosus]|uniref:Uncharacterized protein n=1 Tax=Araneus ventricosus TaxID=182803 RepID=A0A4Y2MVH2_ARAVE|nr:hypothetical protein AVEN_1663-1 [Araneus ventricosus]